MLTHFIRSPNSVTRRLPSSSGSTRGSGFNKHTFDFAKSEALRGMTLLPGAAAFAFGESRARTTTKHGHALRARSRLPRDFASLNRLV